MKRFLLVVSALLITASFGFSMSAKDVGKSLKGWKDKNYTFQKETEKDAGWKVTYTYNETDYTIFFLIADDVVNAEDKNVVIYCDVIADSSPVIYPITYLIPRFLNDSARIENPNFINPRPSNRLSW